MRYRVELPADIEAETREEAARKVYEDILRAPLNAFVVRSWGIAGNSDVVIVPREDLTLERLEEAGGNKREHTL